MRDRDREEANKTETERESEREAKGPGEKVKDSECSVANVPRTPKLEWTKTVCNQKHRQCTLAAFNFSPIENIYT